MTKFLKKLILISLLPAIVIVSIDFWLKSNELSYDAKYNDLISNKNNIEVLALGNSHANYSLDPSQFDKYKAYNLANVSQKIYFDKRLTEKVIQEGVNNLKFVLISVDYHSLYMSSQGIRDNWSYYSNGIKYKDKKYFKADLSPFIWGFTPKATLSIIKKKLINKYTYLDLENGVDTKSKFKSGFLPYLKTKENSFNKEKYIERINSFEEPLDSERDEVINDLNSFIEYLKSKNITPILYTSPTYTEYNKHLDQEILRKNQRDINNICKKYNIQHWDYMNDNQFVKDDFYNADHLNQKGAAKFSKIISEKLNEI